MNDQIPTQTPTRAHHQAWRVSRRTLAKSWDDSIFSESAQAGFWSVLSLPPLLLGMLGSLSYIAPLFGPDTLPTIQARLIGAAGRFFSQNVVTEIIEPTVHDIVTGARGEVVSLGFIISLWAGSSAISAFVDSVVEAHGQTALRHPVRQRFFALFLYVAMQVAIIVAAPFLALGPRKIAEHLPESWSEMMHLGYYPVLALMLVLGVTVLYRASLPKPLPSHRLIVGAILASAVFVVATLGLRIYLRYITSTGYTYGALATPIAFLLFAFFLGLAIMLGAELNAAIEEEWPAPATHVRRLRRWLTVRRRWLNLRLRSGSRGSGKRLSDSRSGGSPTAGSPTTDSPTTGSPTAGSPTTDTGGHLARERGQPAQPVSPS